MSSTFFPLSLAPGPSLLSHTPFANNNSPAAPGRAQVWSCWPPLAAVKQQPLRNVRQGQCLNPQRDSPPVCPSSWRGLEILLHLKTRRDCHTASPRGRSSWVLPPVSPGLFLSFCHRAESPECSLTPFPWDTVMGCDTVFFCWFLR